MSRVHLNISVLAIPIINYQRGWHSEYATNLYFIVFKLKNVQGVLQRVTSGLFREWSMLHLIGKYVFHRSKIVIFEFFGTFLTRGGG